MIKLIAMLAGVSLAANAIAIDAGCAEAARSLFLACDFDVKEGYLGELAVCIDTTNTTQSADCMAAVEAERLENAEECGDIFDARLEICEKLDDGVHDVDFGENFAVNFVDPLEIGITVNPNPWFPLAQGNQWVYQASGIDDEGEEVDETIVVTVTPAVKLIDGIRCLVVNDQVTEDGDLVEDTDDWYAQDVNGNIWYCGELSKNFELFDGDEPELAELTDLDGSFKQGRDGAEAGILIPFAPEPGTTLRQEVLYGDAEDVVDIESLDGTETAPAASCSGNCLVTTDYTALETDVLENKYYVPGIGLIVETKVDSSERVELVDYTVN